MKVLATVFMLATLLVTSGCYSDSTKEAGSDSTERSAPAPSRSSGY